MRHLAKCFVRLQKLLRARIDERDADGHVGEDFLVEDDFALDPAGSFGLTAIKSAAEPCENGNGQDEPSAQDGHSLEKIAERFVSDRLRLLHHHGPSRGLDRSERVKIPAALEVAGLHFGNLRRQNRVT